MRQMKRSMHYRGFQQFIGPRPSTLVCAGLLVCVGLFSPGWLIPCLVAADSEVIQAAAKNHNQDDFQVTIEISEITNDGKQHQLDRHLVIFRDGKAYGFRLFEPRDVTVVEPDRSRVTLISREKNVKSTLSSNDLLKFAAKFKASAREFDKETALGIDAKVNSNAPQFEIAFPGMSYTATTQEPTLSIQPIAFAQFTDWVTRVNLLRRMGAPPFARMTLGRAIAEAKLVPSTVQLIVGEDAQQRTLFSRYTFKRGLSVESDKRLDEVSGMLTLYTEVPLAEFPK